MKFTLSHRDGAARRGRLELAHGTVDTPVFMPVGTYGTVKAMSPEELEGLGAQIVLGNTFHLWLRPGTGVIERHGGLHRFMGWNAPILTDSGGFQVFSLGAMRKITEEGAKFASPINGDRLLLTPEESMNIQKKLNSDVVMVLDECTPSSEIFLEELRLKTWKPPESVRMGRSQPIKRCSPPCFWITSSPGRSQRWKVLPSTICAPSAASSSGDMAFTEP